jgi:hypothetical protein
LTHPNRNSKQNFFKNIFGRAVGGVKRELVRDAKAASLRRFEDSCRTLADFESLSGMYDRLDESRERKERRWEALSVEKFIEWQINAETVVPRPLPHPWWRQLMSGNFIDVIHDCPHDIHELAGSPSVSEPLRELDGNRKEILYYRVVRGWSPQRLAAFRGQTDRNIRKIYDKTIDDLRIYLYNRLSPRYRANEPLTLEQRRFCAYYESGALGKGAKGDEAE